MEKKLARDEQHKMIGGVCAGLADYLSMDITLVRVLFLVSLIFHGAGVVPYIILWIVLPKKVYGANPFSNQGPVDYRVPNQPTGPIDYSVPNFGDFSSAQQTGAPFVPQPKKKSNASIIVGIALVAFGAFFLLDNFDLLPDWEFDRLWPVIFIVAGVVLVFSRRKKNPWEQPDWHATEQPITEAKDDAGNEDHPIV